MRRSPILLVLLMVGCGGPVQAENPDTTTTSTAIASSTTLAGPTTTSTASSPRDDVGIGLVEPDSFGVPVLSGFTSYRVDLSMEARTGEMMIVSSQTAAGTTWHHVLGPDGETDEVIITPGAVWVGREDNWQEMNPEEVGPAFAFAVGPLQLATPAGIYEMLHGLFDGSATGSAIEVDGRDAVEIVGGPDAVALFFGEDPGDVTSGTMTVVFDNTGVPLQVQIEAGEVTDQSIPRSFNWSLTDLGSLTGLELPPAVGEAPALPVIGFGNGIGCEDATDGCGPEVFVFSDGTWETIDDDSRSGRIDPSLLEPVLGAVESVEIGPLLEAHRQGECPETNEVEGRIVLFPGMQWWMEFAQCTAPHDPSISPYREAFTLWDELGLD